MGRWRLLQVELPVPPSTNNLYRTAGRRRVRTAEYDVWWEEAGRGAGWARLTEDARNRIAWEATLEVWLPEREACRRDGDNMLKAALDLACAMTGLRDNARCLRRIEVCLFFVEVARYGSGHGRGARLTMRTDE